MAHILSVQHISKQFGGVHALRDVSFDIEASGVHALMGENGAGKSTLGKVIAGVEQANSGMLVLEGKPLRIQSSMEAQKLGIAMIFQELDLFPNQTVGENLIIGNLALMPEQDGYIDVHLVERLVRPWLDKVGLHIPSNSILGNLPIAQIQLASIARALSMRARLIVMDEPTSALSGEASETLFSLIDKLKAEGVTIIYVSHKMDEIFRIADTIIVMRDGNYVGTRSRFETDASEIISMMVGRKIMGKVRETSWKRPTPLLTVDKLETRKLRKLSFELCEGEILGIAGLVGAGRSELGAALFGLDSILGGEIHVRGIPVDLSTPQKAIAAGIGLVPEDRKTEGLLPQLSVNENMSVSIVGDNHICGFIKRKTVNGKVEANMEQTRIKAPSSAVCVNTLSGGNQQKVLLGRWLLVDPDILFLDDPTRGIDVGAKEDVYELINRLAERGKGIIFVSSELPELLRCADRIMVLHDGNYAGMLDAETTDQKEIMHLAMGL